MNSIIYMIFGPAIFGSLILFKGLKFIDQGNESLVQSLGKYKTKLNPGMHFINPFFDKIVYTETIREKVLDVPKQSCITRDNVAINVDAVVYWRVVDMARAYYKVENLRLAMQNLILTQIRSEMGKLELDQTFTARSEVNETLLRELDLATDPWGVKVTRVELRDIMPSKAVQDSMELQMTAERKRRAAILTSEGERDSAINSAKGKAEAQVLQAEAHKKAAILGAEAEQQALILKAEAERQQQILKAQATAESIQIVAKKLQSEANARESLQFLLAQYYMEMGMKIGSSDSSKVMFMDPRSIPATFEGLRAIVTEQSDGNQAEIFDRFGNG